MQVGFTIDIAWKSSEVYPLPLAPAEEQTLHPENGRLRLRNVMNIHPPSASDTF